MSILEVMKREDILIRLVVLIFASGGLNALILTLSISEITRNPNIILTSTQQIPFITTSPELTILYLSVGITYSVVSSLAFFPKRIVSPFYAQITTATILVITIYTYYFVTVTPTITTELLFGVIVISALIYGILGGVGWLQGWIVRKLIGANGDKDNIDYQTFLINVKFNDITKIITDKYFLRNNKFIWKGKYGDKVILQSRNDNDEKHILVVIPHPEKEDFSILCITSYVIRYDWLTKPKNPFDREGILGMLERLLRSVNNKVELKPDVDDKVATNLALSESLKITSSPFAQVRNYPKRHIVVIGLLVIIGLSIAGVHFYNEKIISNDTFVNSLVFIIIVFIADIYPTIKEKLQK